MSPDLARTISLASLIFTAVMLVVAFFALRKERPLRLRRDLISLALSVAAIAVFGLVTSVTTAPIVAQVAVGAGLLLGLRRGMNLDVRIDGDKALAKHGRAALVVWGVGVLVTQAAAMLVRSGILRLGQGLALLGAASALGFIVGRALPVRRARSAAGLAAVATLPIAVLALGFGGGLLAALAGPATPVQAEVVSFEGDWQATGVFVGQPLAEGASAVHAYDGNTTFTFTVAADGTLTGAGEGSVNLVFDYPDTCSGDCEPGHQDHTDRFTVKGVVTANLRGEVSGDTATVRATHTRSSIEGAISGGPTHTNDEFTQAVVKGFAFLAADALMPQELAIPLRDGEHESRSLARLTPESSDGVVVTHLLSVGRDVTAQPDRPVAPAAAPIFSDDPFSDDPDVAQTPSPSATSSNQTDDTTDGEPLDRIDEALNDVLARDSQALDDLDEGDAAIAAALAAVAAAAAAAAAAAGAAGTAGLAGTEAGTAGGSGEIPIPARPDGLPPKPTGAPPSADPALLDEGLEEPHDPERGPDETHIPTDDRDRLWFDDGAGGMWLSPAEFGQAQQALDEVAQEDLIQDLLTEENHQRGVVQSRLEEEAERVLEIEEAARDARRTQAAHTLESVLAGTGNEDLLDQIRTGELTQDQLRTIFDIMARRQAEAEAIAVVGDPSLMTSAREMANALLQSGADVARLAGQPGAALILENPVASARLAAAIMSGGFTEGVLTPFDIQHAMTEAGEKAAAEGRDFGYGDAIEAGAWNALPGMLIGKLAESIPGLGPKLAGMAPHEAAEAVGRRLGLGRESVDQLATFFGREVDEVAEAGLRRVANADGLSDKAVRRATEVLEEAEDAVHREGSAVWTEGQRSAFNRHGRPDDLPEIPGQSLDAPRPNVEAPREIPTPKGSFEPAEIASRQAAWDANQAEATRLIDELQAASDDLAAAAKSGDAAAHQEALDRVRQRALALQENKQALQHVNDRQLYSNEMRGAMNDSMREVYDQADNQVLDKVSQRMKFGEMKEVGSTKSGTRVFEDANGNQIHIAEPTNPVDPNFIKVGADRDYTIRVGVRDKAGNLVVKDLPRSEIKPVYDQAFYEASGGSARHGSLTPAEVASKYDQMVTDAHFNEAYGKNVEELMQVLKSPGSRLTPAVAQQVGMTMSYKANHWFDHAAQHAGRYEGSMAEGFRQVTKQFDRQILGRVEAMRRLGATVNVPPKLQQAVDLMKETGVPGGKSPVAVEAALRKMGMTPRDVANQMGDYFAALSQLRPKGL